MSNFINLVLEKNAADLKDLFERTVSSKLSNVLQERKAKVGMEFSDELDKHIKFNPYEHNHSPLQIDARGFIGKNSIPNNLRGGISGYNLKNKKGQ